MAMRVLLVALFFVSTTALAGRDCGAEGDWRSNLIPDTWGKAKLYRACQRHDDCYSTLGKTRSSCDQAFKGDMFAECKSAYGWADVVSGCRPAAVGYYEAVVAYGAPYYEAAQEEARNSQVIQQAFEDEETIPLYRQN